jgi:hypothetical protein
MGDQMEEKSSQYIGIGVVYPTYCTPVGDSAESMRLAFYQNKKKLVVSGGYNKSANPAKT